MLPSKRLPMVSGLRELTHIANFAFRKLFRDVLRTQEKAVKTTK